MVIVERTIKDIRQETSKLINKNFLSLYFLGILITILPAMIAYSMGLTAENLVKVFLSNKVEFIATITVGFILQCALSLGITKVFVGLARESHIYFNYLLCTSWNILFIYLFRPNILKKT